MGDNMTVTFSETIGKLSEALAKAQGSMANAKKSSDNPFFKSKYADLAEVWDTCRKPLSENSLAVIQLPGAVDATGNIEITTMLAHSSGEWIKGVMFIKAAKNDAQSIGSAITYGRRYALAALVGIAQEDDDGEGATGRTPDNQPKQNAKANTKQYTKPDTKPDTKADTKPVENNGNSQLKCSVCGIDIDHAVSEYALKTYGMELCRVCQAKKKQGML